MTNTRGGSSQGPQSNYPVKPLKVSNFSQKFMFVDLPANQQKVLSYISTWKEYYESNRRSAKRINMKERTFKWCLAELKKKGLILKIGTTKMRTVKYEIAQKTIDMANKIPGWDDPMEEKKKEATMHDWAKWMEKVEEY